MTRIAILRFACTCSGFLCCADKLICRSIQITFQCFYRLLGSFRQLFVTGVGIADRRLQDRDGVFRTSWCVLAQLVDQRQHLAIGFGDLCFCCLGKFSLGAGRDTCQVTAICQCFFSIRLRVRSAQRKEFLWVCLLYTSPSPRDS